MNLLSEALLATILRVVPGHAHHGDPWQEHPAMERARYAEIAMTIAKVSPQPGDAALLLGMAIGEGDHLAADVDGGRCMLERDPTRCDRGLAQSLWQIRTDVHPGDFSDRETAARFALDLMRKSINACRALPERYRLSAYGCGKCIRLEAAAVRWSQVQRVHAVLSDELRRRAWEYR